MRLSSELKEELRKLAAKEHRTVSNLMEMAIIKFIEEKQHGGQVR